MVKVSRAAAPLTVKVTVALSAATAMLAAEMFRLEVNETVPAPALNRHPAGGVRIMVSPLPLAKSVFTPSAITILPSAVNAAPLVELSALSAERFCPPAGFVMVTLAITPLARVARYGAPMDVRRMLGVGPPAVEMSLPTP